MKYMVLWCLYFTMLYAFYVMHTPMSIFIPYQNYYSVEIVTPLVQVDNNGICL